MYVREEIKDSRNLLIQFVLLIDGVDHIDHINIAESYQHLPSHVPVL